jgi:hypothetical protein
VSSICSILFSVDILKLELLKSNIILTDQEKNI